MTNVRSLLVPLLITALSALPTTVAAVAAKEAANELGKQPATAAPAADVDFEILRDAIRANKKALVAASLDLTDGEKTKFWPLYDGYQQELTAISDRYLKIIDDYTASFATLDDARAKQLLDDYLAAEADRVKLRRDWVPKFADALPGRKLARFYQIENKMDAVVRFDLARTIPVVQQP